MPDWIEELTTATEPETGNERRLAESTRLIEGLGRGDAYPHPVGKIGIAETHISWVLLTGEWAYKIKKPVHLPFLDFSTLEKRHKYCQSELELNRRLAPELYDEVVPVGGSIDRPRLGEEPAIEYAVRMVQFDPEHVLDSLLGSDRIPAAGFVEFAGRLAAFHDELPPVRRSSSDSSVFRDLEELRSEIGADAGRRLEPIEQWLRQEFRRLEPWMRKRERDGAIRECHGDLHLGNLVWIRDRIVPFDCLEFDRRLRCIDRVDELAFLAMDLHANERPGLAFEFLNRYFEATGDYSGLRLLRFFMVSRALVRCKVRHLSVAGRATPYLDLAGRLVAYGRPTLIMTFGFSGSGKTTLTGDLIPRLPAIRVRSDIERKRLYGLEPGADSSSPTGRGIYSSDASDATYAALGLAAEAALAAGINVIVDAACLERGRREALYEVAHAQAANCVILSCEADESTLRTRIAERQSTGEDASEADLAVLDRQLELAEPIVDDGEVAVIRVDTGQPVSVDRLVDAIAGSASR